MTNRYVKGARCSNAQGSAFEGNTAVFTKRRYRDAWNRTLVKRIGEAHSHALKIKGRVRAKGQRGTNWYSQAKVNWLKGFCRTQNLWLNRLAGDWLPEFETDPRGAAAPHLMRVLLNANLAVDQRFANGTQGRLVHWQPDGAQSAKAAVSASHPELTARFVKENSLHKPTIFPEVDFIDLSARAETLRVAGEPVMLQLPVGPCYAMTNHKVQSLSITHTVRGCLEGVFAFGRVYVLISRATGRRCT